KQCSGGGNNVTKKLPKCYTDIEKDKETELEQEQDLEKEQDTERDKDKKKEKESKMNIQTDADTETEAGTAEDRKISSCGSYINNNIRSADKSDKSDMELAGKHNQFEMEPVYKNNQSEMKVIGTGNTSTGSNNTKYLAIDLEEESSDSSLKVYKHFEKCGFIVTSQLMEFISEDIKSYGEEWIMDAATECVKRGKSNNYGYLTGILQNWITKGRNYKEICESKANASAYAPMKSIFDE
ncbi:MAG: DnaD domain protein, partial [Clostridia bacterium]|nr:DnaD domain protein [Clostridia bacterium]